MVNKGLTGAAQGPAALTLIIKVNAAGCFVNHE